LVNWILKYPKVKQQLNLLSSRNDPYCYDRVSPFIKRETTKGKVPGKARAIQAYYKPCVGVEKGPEYYAFQKAIGQATDERPLYIGNKTIHITIASGMNHGDIGKWMDKVTSHNGKLQFYERDGKSWDATMRYEHLDMVNELMYQCDSELAKHNRKCYDAYGKYKDKMGNKIRYKLIGTRKSGHQDTSSGNSWINAQIALSAALLLSGELTIYIIVMGDDMLMAIIGDTDENYVEILKAYERKTGITPEARGFSNVLDVTFISACWYPRVDGTYAFGPIIGKQLIGLFWTVKPICDKMTKVYTSSVARAFLPSFEDCPVMEEFLRRQITTSSEMEIDKYLKKLVPMKGIDWSFYFEAKYQLAAEDCSKVNEYLRTLPRQPLMIVNPVMDKIIDVDTADISVRPLCTLSR